MSAFLTTGVAWRTDGFWTLFWLRIWLYLTSSSLEKWPPKGFVGTVSGLLVGTGPRMYSLLSTRLLPEASTPDARLWRLTCVWGIFRRPKRIRKSGSF